MKFLSAADFDDAITAASKIRAATSYALLAVGVANSAYSNGALEAYTPPGAYAAGARPGIGFHASGSFGTYMYAQASSDLRLRTDAGLDYTLWHSGNSRSDSQNDTRYSQLGHTHTISEVSGLQSALDSKYSGSSTVGRIPKNVTSTTFGDSLLSESGIALIANGGVFVSDVPQNSNVRGYSLWASGFNRWVFGKAGTESGSDSGSDFVLWSYNDAGTFVREPLRISRATGNITFSGSITASGGNSTNWNTAYSWGNHASAGYVPSSRTITINGTTFDLSTNRTWTVAGGVGGSGTAGFIPAWITGSTLGNSSISEDTTFVTTTKSMKVGYDGLNRYIQHDATPTSASTTYYNPDSAAGWLMMSANDLFAIGNFGAATNVAFHYRSEGNFASFVPPNANARGFILGTTSGSGSARWNVAKAGLETGSNAGSDLVFWAYDDSAAFLRENLRVSRASGNATFSGTIAASGGNSTNWNTAYGWGNHASASYVPSTRTITINGSTFDLSANRSWTISGAGFGGSGTTGRLPKLSGPTTLADSILSESGIGIIANGGVFVSDVAHNSNVRGYSLWASGLNRWVFGKAGTEAGSDSGSDFVLWSYNDAGTFVREPFRVSRATGNVTFTGTITASGGGSANWNTAYSWGNHASAGYATLNYVTTNYYTRPYIDSELGIRAYAGISITGQYSLTGGGTLEAHRQITLLNDQLSPGSNKYYGTDGSGGKGWYSLPSSGGVSGSGTANIITMWNGSTSLTNSSILQAVGSVFIGGVSDRYNLICSGAVTLRSMSASELASYTPPATGSIVYQYDGTEGLYMYKSTGWQYVG